ncbi:MAG: hypothetical protein HFI41_01070 [Lachnospiraceae bacterium]|nr:hypothetical protein [Lachnospiraceae bacterium]
MEIMNRDKRIIKSYGMQGEIRGDRIFPVGKKKFPPPGKNCGILKKAPRRPLAGEIKNEKERKQ